MVYVTLLFVPLFFALALIVWLPAFALVRWRVSKPSLKRYAWAWAWMLPAAATVTGLALTGFIADVMGSV